MPEIWFPHLNIEIMNLDRVFVTIFGVDIYWYGIFIALAFLAGIYVAVFNAKRSKIDSEVIFDFIPIAMILAIVGARLYYVIFSFSYYKNNLGEIFALRDGGLGIYGGIIATFLGFYIYCRKKKIDFLSYCDLAIPGVALGQSIGRWGNFFNKEAFGGYTDNLFAMRIRTDVASFIPKDLQVLSFNGANYIQVHPTFLYESFMDFCIFLILMYFYKKKKFDGQIFFTYFILYGTGRFFIESLREDQLLFLGIPISMIVSFAFVVMASCLMYFKLKNVESIEKAD